MDYFHFTNFKDTCWLIISYNKKFEHTQMPIITVPTVFLAIARKTNINHPFLSLNHSIIYIIFNEALTKNNKQAILCATFYSYQKLMRVLEHIFGIITCKCIS